MSHLQTHFNFRRIELHQNKYYKRALTLCETKKSQEYVENQRSVYLLIASEFSVNFDVQDFLLFKELMKCS